jgi:hypothetical protein
MIPRRELGRIRVTVTAVGHAGDIPCHGAGLAESARRSLPLAAWACHGLQWHGPGAGLSNRRSRPPASSSS